MGKRLVRMGIDVGGTHTKAVAIDNATHEIIGKSSVKTTHDDVSGVAAGVVAAFQNCLRENDIAPEDVIFVAHSTTQATNALIEGDVATVGVVGMGPKGMEGVLSRAQTKLKDIDLGSGRKIVIKNRYLKDDEVDEDTVRKAVEELKAEGAQVMVASDAYGVDDIAGEQFVYEIAHDEMGFETTLASDITKLYGLTRRTRTAAINASILPKMLNTANSTESSVREAGVEVPLMIMRGDGGVMESNEMKKRPVLTSCRDLPPASWDRLCTCAPPTECILKWAVRRPISVSLKMGVLPLITPSSADTEPISVLWMCVCSVWPGAA